MTLRQREPRHRDDAHLAFVRASGCVVCPKGVNRPIEAAHVRMACIAIGKRETGMAEKPRDQWTVGLCDYHHRTGVRAQHKISEAEFWQDHGRNPFEICRRLWVESGGAARAAERAANPPAPKPRKIKARKPAERRQKIRSSATLQSRGFGDQHRPMQSRNNFERRP